MRGRRRLRSGSTAASRNGAASTGSWTWSRATASPSSEANAGSVAAVADTEPAHRADDAAETVVTDGVGLVEADGEELLDDARGPDAGHAEHHDVELELAVGGVPRRDVDRNVRREDDLVRAGRRRVPRRPGDAGTGARDRVVPPVGDDRPVLHAREQVVDGPVALEEEADRVKRGSRAALDEAGADGQLHPDMVLGESGLSTGQIVHAEIHHARPDRDAAR